jgi:nitroimidazol reductase NimA-like FMN-containing flavoprotein (pyridoxamine 5'-phosphate oxidase superfamily)
MLELTEAESWDLLRLNSRSGIGRIAVAIMNHPDIFPVNYAVVDGDADGLGGAPSRGEGPVLVFRSAEGTKLAAAVLGTAVAFEIDGYDAVAGEAWSVVVKGQAIELQPAPGDLGLEDLPLFPWLASPKHRFVMIVPEEVSGRRFHVVEANRPTD